MVKRRSLAWPLGRLLMVLAMKAAKLVRKSCR